MYEGGRGVGQSDAEACRLFRLAADQDNALAQLNLGTMYGEGRGVEQDHREAYRWYRRAADQGDADTQRRLGSMYESGKGVEKNIPMARHWYGLAASQGDARAQGALRSMRPKSGRSPRAPPNRPPLCPLPRQCRPWPRGRSRPVSWTRRSSSS